MMKLNFSRGVRDGLPIALGYFPVSFAFGLESVRNGLPIWAAILTSMTNLTSAGQFAGVVLILQGSSYLEMALTELIINLRYFLMSVLLSQKADKTIKFHNRFLISFGVTDEIFAIASSRDFIGRNYMLGLILLPYIGWASGTALGALLGSVLPASVMSALGIALYGMFIAIILPPAKRSWAVGVVILASIAMSCAFSAFKLTDGARIIICTIIASLLGAIIHPIKDDPKESGAAEQ